MYVEEDLVFYHQPFADQNEMFDFMADRLEKKNYVTEGFRAAIKEREQNYPTGLKLTGMNVAIVHTEAEFSKTEKLVVLKLENPVRFRDIESLQPLDVHLVFGLILSDSNKHLEILQKISQFLQDPQKMREIDGLKSQQELALFMKRYFDEGENGQ